MVPNPHCSWRFQGGRIVTSVQVDEINLRERSQLGMGADPDDSVVEWPSLSWVVEDFHDCGRLLRLRRDGGSGVDLSAEGVFSVSRKEGKYGEQEPPNPFCCVAWSI